MGKVHSKFKLKYQLKHIMARGMPYLPVERCYSKKCPKLKSLQQQNHKYLESFQPKTTLFYSGTPTLRKLDYKNYTKIGVKTHLKEGEKMMKEMYGVFIG